LKVALRLLSRPRGCGSFLRRAEFDAGPACFGETYRDRLFWRACAVLSFAHVTDLFTDEFAGLSRWSFAPPSRCFGSLDGSFFGHRYSPLANLKQITCQPYASAPTRSVAGALLST
jgi:hypothetical protein